MHKQKTSRPLVSPGRHAVNLDAQIARVAARQHGLVTLAQARDVGATEDAIRHRVNKARWVRVRLGVFAIAGVPATSEQSILAAVFAAGDAAFVSHGTAAELWELPLPAQKQVEVTTPIERVVRLKGVTAHRSGTLVDLDVTSCVGIPVTTATRAIFDLSSRFDDTALGRALDDGLRRKIASLSGLHAIALRLPGIAAGRSPARIHRLLKSRIPGYDPGDSELETHVFEVLQMAGLPLPTRRYHLLVGGRRFVIDLAYPRQRIAIEVDGFGPHGTRTAFDEDRERQNALVLAGMRVLRFTSRSADAEICETVSNALSVRSPGP